MIAQTTDVVTDAAPRSQDRPAVLARIPMQRTALAPACPGWCSLPPGHDWPLRDPSWDRHRDHASNGAGYRGPELAFISAFGEVGAEEFKPRVQIEAEPCLTASQARALAAELLVLADILEPRPRAGGSAQSGLDVSSC